MVSYVMWKVTSVDKVCLQATVSYQRSADGQRGAHQEDYRDKAGFIMLSKVSIGSKVRWEQ